MKKKIISIFLVAVMVLSAIPFTASAAATAIATFAELQTAFANGGTYELTQDITVTELLTLESEITLSIDGQNHIVSVPEPGLTAMGTENPNASDWGVFKNSGNLTLSNMTIRAGSGDGVHGIYNEAPGALKMVGCTIERCRHTGWEGGAGLNNEYDAKCYLYECKISRNCSMYGGGLLNRGILVMDGCSLNENRSTECNGGGGAGEIGDGLFIMNNCTIANNTSSEIGGALNCNGGYIYLLNTTVVGNITTCDGCFGGGIGLNGLTTMYLINDLMVNNYAYNNGEPVASDVGAFCGSGGVHMVGSVYNSFVELNAPEGNTQMANDEQMAAYVDTPIIPLNPDDASQDVYQMTYHRPVIKLNSRGTYDSPMKSTATGVGKGVTAYLELPEDVSTFSNNTIKLGYLDSTTGTITDIDGVEFGLAVPDASAQVVIDQNADARATNLPGAVNTDDRTYATLTAKPITKGYVEGATVYGDTYLAGTSVTVSAVPYAGNEFLGWYVGDTLVSTNLTYTFTLNEDTLIEARIQDCSHTYGTYIDNYIDETCTTDACYDVYCTQCNGMVQSSVTDTKHPALGHDLYSVEYVPSTAEARYSGYEVIACSRCDYGYTRYVRSEGDGYNIQPGWYTVPNSGDTAYPESAHDYGSNSNEYKTLTVPGATKLRVTFSSDSETESRWDGIYLYQGVVDDTNVGSATCLCDDQPNGYYSGADMANETIEIEGNSFTVNLFSDGSWEKWGYAFSSIEAYGDVTVDVGAANDDLIYVAVPEVMENSKYYATLALNDNIDVDLLIKNDDLTDEQRANMIVTANSRTIPMTKGTTYISGELASVAPFAMGDDIEVVVRYGALTVKSFTYSVKDYCNAVLASDAFEADHKALCETALHYGAWAQKYADYDTENLVNEGLTDTTADVDFANVTPYIFSKSKVVTQSTASLTIGSRVAINFTFTSMKALTLDDIYVVNNLNQMVPERNLELKDLGKNQYRLIVKNIGAAKIGRNYTVCTYEGSLPFITYGVGNYCVAAQDLEEGDNLAELKGLCKAMYAYGEAATAYGKA